jgi:hypothetical protein
MQLTQYLQQPDIVTVQVVLSHLNYRQNQAVVQTVPHFVYWLSWPRCCCMIACFRLIVLHFRSLFASNRISIYVDCSKCMRRDFFPRKLMKHGRCAVVRKWRVPSCAYLNFFPPTDSVSRMQPACVCECVRSARRIVIFCENDDCALVSGLYP